MTETTWQASGWEAEYFAPYLCITNPAGETGLVILKEGNRNVTAAQFRSSVKTHGALKACHVFWKLRANQC